MSMAGVGDRRVVILGNKNMRAVQDSFGLIVELSNFFARVDKSDEVIYLDASSSPLRIYQHL